MSTFGCFMLTFFSHYTSSLSTNSSAEELRITVTDLSLVLSLKQSRIPIPKTRLFHRACSLIIFTGVVSTRPMHEATAGRNVPTTYNAPRAKNAGASSSTTATPSMKVPIRSVPTSTGPSLTLDAVSTRLLLAVIVARSARMTMNAQDWKGASL